MADMEPGQLIVPHGTDEPGQPGGGSPEPERPTEDPEPTPEPAPIPDESSQSAAASEPASLPQPDQPAGPAANAPDTGWQFTPEANSAPAQSAVPQPLDDLNWTASEFIAHDKGASWYAMLAIGAIVVAVLIYLITKDKITTGIIVFVAVVFGAFAGRKPNVQQYSLTGQGLQIGQKFYNLQDFKTFSVGQEGAIASIVLNPLKRFMPPLTIYVAPDMAESVVNFLSNYLPFEQHKTDAVDSLLRRIRF